ncbi:signal peptidase complex subunit 2 [Paraphysoderma sedebokerense]|nr:signal peptidase complex subunit 2 [Paraphysoderma sedebokerense]
MIVVPEKENSSFLNELAKNSISVPLYSLSDHKNTLDDAVTKILTKDLGVQINNSIIDTKLVLGYLAGIIGLCGSGYGYTVPFEDSKLIVGASVITYIVLNIMMILHSILKEGKIVFVGVKKDPLGVDSPSHITIQTTTSKSTNYEYHLTVTVSEPPNKSNPSSTKSVNLVMQKSFGSYFDDSGRLVGEPFWRDLCELVESGVNKTGKGKRE